MSLAPKYQGLGFESIYIFVGPNSVHKKSYAILSHSRFVWYLSTGQKDQFYLNKDHFIAMDNPFHSFLHSQKVLELHSTLYFSLITMHLYLYLCIYLYISVSLYLSIYHSIYHLSVIYVSIIYQSSTGLLICIIHSSFSIQKILFKHFYSYVT